MEFLNLASVRSCTEAEGPGKRFAIWVQGCRRRCPGCCNPEMQELRRNIIVDTAGLIRLIQTARKDFEIEGISLIGGEPLLQAEGLSEIAVWCQSEGLSVLVFTGYTYQTLQASKEKSVHLLLEHTDILVDGPFLQELYDEERTWVGSQNQHVIFLTNRYTPGIEYTHPDRTMELLISDKDILINGWPF